MCGTRHVLHRCRLGNRDVLQRIEKLDRHLKFFVKELAHVGHSSTAATQENANRAISLLLGAVVRDGTHQFCMEPGHGAACDFRNPRNVGIGRFGVCAAQSPKPSRFLRVSAAANDSLNSLAIAAVIALPPSGMLRKKILPDSMKRMFVVRAPISSNNEQSPTSG